MSMSRIVPGRGDFTWLVGERLPEVEIGVWRPSELSSPAAGVEFTRRELEVLRYLPSMLTAGEIAGELFVSVNTIKAHMRSIYRKLGVSRRRDAVVRAYECGVLRRLQRSPLGWEGTRIVLDQEVKGAHRAWPRSRPEPRSGL
jgi:DNA-binding CsgD family transcriptional regulator